jgi:hypothetical protein
MLVAGVLVAVSLVLWARLFRGYPPTPAGALAPREAALVAAASDTLFPGGGPIGPSGSEAGIPGYAARYVGEVPAPTRLLMRALFALVEHGTLLFPAPGRGGFRRFSSLDRLQREAVLEGWQGSRFFPRRLVFTSLRAILTMGYFADRRVLAALSLQPRVVEAPVTTADALYPPVGQALEAIRHSDADVTVRRPTDRPPAAAPLGPEGPVHPAFRLPSATPAPADERRP